MKKNLFFLLFPLTLLAQKPKAVFLSDSIKVGKEIQLSMSYIHDSKSAVFFPDSTFDFTPFKYVKTTYFETQTTSPKTSLDSVVYTLVTYSLDSVISIVPYVVNLKNDKKIYADTARVFLKSTLSSQSLKENNPKEILGVFKVKKDINIPKISYFLLGVLLVGSFIVFFFGDWIVKRFRLWQFDKQQTKFSFDFKRKSLKPKELKNIQASLAEWKSHMEWLEEGKPISTMSTSEIIELYQDEKLGEALKMFDAAIYGGFIDTKLPSAYSILLNFSNLKYKDQRLAKLP